MCFFLVFGCPAVLQDADALLSLTSSWNFRFPQVSKFGVESQALSSELCRVATHIIHVSRTFSGGSGG